MTIEITKRHLHAWLLGLLMICTALRSHAGDLVPCVNRKVTFDGLVRLHYATVKRRSGPRLYLHAHYPEHCASQDQPACSGRAYLIPGNAVAIGKECAGWDYVQYIGEKRISEGWVDARGLSPISAQPPKLSGTGHDVGPPLSRRRYRFGLTRGKGTPVCEAYLQRLNQMVFFAPPYCGRPEFTAVPGFRKLRRIPLTASQTASLFFRIIAFMGSKNSNRRISIDPQDKYNIAASRSGGNGPAIVAWRYEPEPDVDNDGRLENIIVWRGAPIAEMRPPCGSSETAAGTELPRGIRWPSLTLVANESSTRIEDGPTVVAFGSPTGGLPVPNINHRPELPNYVPIGSSIQLFEYGGLTYFDTFYDGQGWPDFYGKRSQAPYLGDRLAGFIRRDMVTSEVCEYRYFARNYGTPKEKGREIGSDFDRKLGDDARGAVLPQRGSSIPACMNTTGDSPS